MQNDISINHLFFNYDGATVLEDINLQYNRTEFLAIIGPNGGGKSTLLKLIIGLLEPSLGEILLFGKKPLHVSHEIAYVPQDTIANKDFPIKVLDVVLMGRLSKSKFFAPYSKEDYTIAYEMLEKVGMKGFENQKINTLSGGQRQRVFIARALACDAKIIFLDEPTASIDTAGQMSMFQLLKTLNENVGIVIISHDINVALHYASKVAHVNKILYLHDLCDTQATETLKKTNSHFCPIELIHSRQCHHTHKELLC
ncbi:metal ABC transporter ATP-binding protein [Sulfurospirillum barnesii]|uniref:ATPase component of Mn/Zn ABC-type transporter n=1 Tax=Sulfurospirillum barnesii (strain ATCC 700032 / DSM 10660 / SES-3) TaxID=760154 RepID=I3XU51_SULBS|nr:ABC transporter ATP-binding protein [Sulfurospirillum barnesii]AFL67475.1 ATPase component of Mn/Zn ABC-type transporter [Sulfurospirillum barnesii SES-3]